MNTMSMSMQEACLVCIELTVNKATSYRECQRVPHAVLSDTDIPHLRSTNV